MSNLEDDEDKVDKYWEIQRKSGEEGPHNIFHSKELLVLGNNLLADLEKP